MNLTTWQVDVVMAGASIEPCQRCGAPCWVQRPGRCTQYICLDGCGRTWALVEGVEDWP